MIIAFETWKAAPPSVSATSATPPFLGQPVISDSRCPFCGTRFLGYPRWHDQADGGGWIEFDEACAYGCRPGWSPCLSETFGAPGKNQDRNSDPRGPRKCLPAQRKLIGTASPPR
jgi:hypothetical protein